MVKDFRPTQQCGRFASALRWEDIPADVIDRMKRDLLDWCGCAVRGSADPVSRPIRDYVALTGGAPQAGVFGAPGRTDHRSAAMMNAWYGHILEMDDVDRDSISHPATCVFPAVLSLASYGRSHTGREMLTAVVAGFEVMLRIGAAITPGHYRVFHTTGTTGVFGAASAASRLIGLDEKRTVWALGNAGTSACSLWQFNPDGAMSKFLHTANAAGNGLMTALLAERGFTGAHRILEGEQGFFRGYARQDVRPEIFEDWGTRWRAGTVSFKPYPCCRHTHSAIDAALALREQLGGEKIRRLVLHTYNTALSIAGKRDPATDREAKFSISWCVASAVLHGVPTERSFAGEALRDEAVQALEHRIEVVDDPEISACVPRNWPCRIEAETVSGRRIETQVQAPKGDPENEVDWDGIEAKFRVMTDGILGASRQDRMIAVCQKFDELERFEEGDLFEAANRK